MGLLLTLVLGGLAGYIASLITKREDLGIFWNIVVGILGAIVANVVIAPIVNVSADLHEPSLASFVMAVLGASLLLVVLNLLTRNSIR